MADDRPADDIRGCRPAASLALCSELRKLDRHHPASRLLVTSLRSRTGMTL